MAKNIQFEILNVQGTEYTTTLTEKFRKRKNYQTPNPNLIHSVMPGTICEVFVKEGQTVKAGSKLLMLEAMKMQNIVEAPFDCKIKMVNVKQNQQVPKNYLLVEME